ncbi:FecR domain-containing protein [Chitinophaga sp. YIM B06452]|uniref:FecR family protein n=1 Tax=Chitinophaga sp. YIM B06452 TaxID=3082158 RepID=UPI0031FF167C
MDQDRDYSKFTTTDFFTDDLFVRHVLSGDDASSAYWQAVAREYPRQAGAMEQARLWIWVLNKQAIYQPKVPASEAWAAIEANIAEHSRRRQYYRPLRIAARWAGAVAASLLLMIAIREFSAQGKKTYVTDFGKREQIVLPDESIITLNANSSIHYDRTWRSGKPREIWLTGEAYFEVKHVAVRNRLQQSDSFHVHVGGLDLTVLGTRFNIKNRRRHTEISLLEGSLRIARTGAGAFVKIIKPGEAFVWDSTQLRLREMERTPDASRSWTHDELDLDGYSLREILNVLQDTYGYSITLQAPELAEKRLTGTIPAQNAEDILFVLKKVFDLKIEQENKHLTISQN